MGHLLSLPTVRVSSLRPLRLRSTGASLLGLLIICCTPTTAFSQRIERLGPFFQGDRILVEGTVNQQKVRMILDTGASYSALFLPAARRLGVVGENPPASGTPPGKALSQPFDLAMFGKNARMRIPIVDFTSNEPVDGVFSWGHLAAGVVLIDGFDRTVTTLKEAPASEAWERWPLETGKSQLFFHITRQQEPYGRVFLDTGADCGLRVHPEIWKAWRKASPEVGVTLGTFRYALGETMVHEMAWAREFRLGDLTFYDVPVSPLRDEEAEQVGPDYRAMIGIQVLRNLRVVVDRRTNQVLTQSIRPAMRHNRLGAVFVAGGEAKEAPRLIAHVLPDTPAAQAGLKEGNILVAVEGLAALTEGAVNHAFTQPAGTKIALTVQTDDGRKEIVVTLRDLLP